MSGTDVGDAIASAAAECGIRLSASEGDFIAQRINEAAPEPENDTRQEFLEAINKRAKAAKRGPAINAGVEALQLIEILTRVLAMKPNDPA